MLSYILSIGAVTAVLVGLAWRGRRLRRRSIRLEDSLKLILSAELEDRLLTVSELAGELGLRTDRAMLLVEMMQTHGLVRYQGEGLALTRTGRDRALPLLRAHRLLERYLADEAGLSLEQLHARADRAEHDLSREQINRLNEELGHPDLDPHGDPIPDADGLHPPQKRVSLRDWPADERGVVLHVEDEPPGAMRRLLAAGLSPRTAVRVKRRDDESVTFETAAGESTVSAALAGMVHVGEEVGELVGGAMHTLADLPAGQNGEVVGLSPDCRGLPRRRLLDLGFTRGALVQAELANAWQSARAYRVRTTLIALRREQARMVRIRPRPAAEGSA